MLVASLLASTQAGTDGVRSLLGAAGRCPGRLNLKGQDDECVSPIAPLRCPYTQGWAGATRPFLPCPGEPCLPRARESPSPQPCLRPNKRLAKLKVLTPSSRLKAALTESEVLAKAENQAVSRKRTRFHRLGARYQRKHRRASFFSFSATGKQSKATSLSCHSAALTEDDTDLTTSLHVILNGLICPDPVLQQAARATVVKGALDLLQSSNNSLKPRKPTAPNLLPPNISDNSSDLDTQPAAPGDDAATGVRTDQQLPGEVPRPSPGAAIANQPRGSLGSGLPGGAEALDWTGLQGQT
ncbi:hypothetical protein V8C86DRAFT_1391550 [Haematococcus lacustris]